MDVGAAGAPS
ncbi:Putative uncharacterized protein [Escherichia coli D6-117.29]|nr:Putative uncharacterized protein [Escherichia coli D6-117.29]